MANVNVDVFTDDYVFQMFYVNTCTIVNQLFRRSIIKTVSSVKIFIFSLVLVSFPFHCLFFKTDIMF